MPAGVSSIDLAALVCHSPQPVLFFDTAGILDILRVSFRQELQVDVIAAAAELVDDLSVTPRRIWTVTTGNVVQELHANRDAVRQELSTHISNVRQSVSRLARVAKLVVPEKRIDPLDWLDAMVEERVVGVRDRFVASMSLFHGTPDCIARARNRLWAGHPPASKSKQEYKDCEIFEEFLELAGTLRRSGFEQPIVFVSPNSKDYGRPPNGHSSIAAELLAVRCQYVGHASWARAVVDGELT